MMNLVVLVRDIEEVMLLVPYCITIDEDTINNGTVTIRDRDTMEQTTVKVEELTKYIEDRIKF